MFWYAVLVSVCKSGCSFTNFLPTVEGRDVLLPYGSPADSNRPKAPL